MGECRPCPPDSVDPSDRERAANRTLPLVSIVTPSFNHAAFIGETLRQLQFRTTPEFDHIVVDGGSTGWHAREFSPSGEDTGFRNQILGKRTRSTKGSSFSAGADIQLAELGRRLSRWPSHIGVVDRSWMGASG